MASSVIHMAVANEVNKIIKKDYKSVLIGSIAPDIAKHIGEDKHKSHFLIDNNDIPDIETFYLKYKDNFNDDFVIGYYIHLLTDYLWFKYFEPDFYKNGIIYKLDGSIEKVSDKDKMKYFYNDYTNLNISLLDEYDLNLSIFYDDIPNFNNIIEEIPMDKIKIIVDKSGIIIENSKESKAYVFDMDVINKFVKTSVNYILNDFKERRII